MAAKQENRSHLVLQSKRQKSALLLNETKGKLNEDISLCSLLILDAQVY